MDEDRKQTRKRRSRRDGRGKLLVAVIMLSPGRVDKSCVLRYVIHMTICV